ncbi:MAG: GGDEF domain-containing protein [Proteobacteria bacterium]|nr:GGDEF domain-containing protein [Pseudomonadota bacterium]
MKTKIRTRYRVGIVIDAVHELYQTEVWRGIYEEARRQQVDLLTFIATSQDGISRFETHYDIVRDFATHSDVDGYILFSGSIAEHQGTPFLSSLSQQLSHRPLVSLSMRLPGVPSILVDNAAGVAAIVEHFVIAHNLQRIAFVAGPPGHEEADIRFAAYQDALKRHGIPLATELIFPGTFLKTAGAHAVQSLIENNIAFDSLIAANDEMAFGALEELARRAWHVPVEVAVAGFDDVASSAMTKPPLTTVRQPLNQMGTTALSLLINQLKGIAVEPVHALPAEPTFRRSCGCFPTEFYNARPISKPPEELDKEALTQQLTRIILHMSDETHPAFPGEDTIQKYMHDLLESLILNVQRPTIRYIFLNEIDMLLFRLDAFGNSIQTMRIVTNRINTQLSVLFTESADIAEAGNMLQQAKLLLNESENNRNQNAVLNASQKQLHVDIICQRLISSFEQRELLDTLRTSLPEVGIESFAIALYGDPFLTGKNWTFPKTAKLLLSQEGANIAPAFPRGDTTFSTELILPNGLPTDPHTPQTHLFLPLFHRDEQLGYLLLQYVPGAPLFMYEELRIHVASALKSALLLREFKTKSMLDELTGVYNRRGFMHQAAAQIRAFQAQKNDELLLLYCDINGLKHVNDTYGHHEGDVLIRAAAEALTNTFREGDLIARVGGDEFVVLLQAPQNPTLANQVLQRLRQQVQRANIQLEKPFSLSISVGTAQLVSGEDSDIETLMRLADNRMLQNKNDFYQKRESSSVPPAP